MAVDRLSVTVPSELGAALRALAEARGATVSTVVADAIAHQVMVARLIAATNVEAPTERDARRAGRRGRSYGDAR